MAPEIPVMNPTVSTSKSSAKAPYTGTIASLELRMSISRSDPTAADAINGDENVFRLPILCRSDLDEELGLSP